jgi:tRNA(Ile)-lysidine synthase TilS/MesJ
MNLTIDKKWKRIGISLSGGADSALLAYILLPKYAYGKQGHGNVILPKM